MGIIQEALLNHALIAPYKEQLLAKALPAVEISLTHHDKSLSLWQSKVGGLPYLPKGNDYPHGFDGKPLCLLAQINFSEVPKLEGFPEKGILQFFVDATDDLIGMEDCDGVCHQNKFRVIYYPEVKDHSEELMQDFSAFQLSEHDENMLPFEGAYAMTFTQYKQLPTVCDFGFELIVKDEHGEVSDELLEWCYDNLDGEGHRIGGYPYFTQDDPRAYQQDLQDYILLFQLASDCDGENEIMWGDCGVGNFFIHPDDLKNLDFSKVLYYWDCC